MNPSESEKHTGGLFRRYKWPLALVLIAALVGYRAVRDPWSSNVSTKMLPLRSSSSNEEIRKLLLSHTPIGSKAVYALKFILDDLQPKRKWPWVLHVGVVKTLQKERGDPRVFLTDYERDEGDEREEGEPNSISLLLGSRAEFFDCKLVYADWIFDNDDRLTDIQVYRLYDGSL